MSVIETNEIVLLSMPDLKEERRLGSAFLESPRGLAFLDDDQLAVADYHNSRIVVVSLSEGSVIFSFGRPEVPGSSGTRSKKPGWETDGINPEGHLRWPTDVAVSAITGEFFVADTWNHRVQVFDRNGSLSRKIGEGEGSAPGHFKHPRGIAISPTDDTVAICDLGNDRISLWKQDGSMLGQFGSSGKGLGQFRSPTGVAFLDTGKQLVVTDFGNDRVQSLALASGQSNSSCSASGAECTEIDDAPLLTVLSTMGVTGAGQGQLSSPAGLIGTGKTSVLVADFGNHRITALEL